MKIIKTTLLLTLMMLTITVGVAQKKKKKKQNRKKTEVAAVKVYEGPELPPEQLVRLVSETVGKKYAYFIAVDEKDIPNMSLMSGAQEILLLPGDHTIKMRFVSKGEIAIPTESFDFLSFEAGKSYVVKFEYTPGEGSYLVSAGNTRIRLWIEEVGQASVLIEQTVDGFGKRVEPADK
ncbi:hypothetical protein FNH22_25315 [Fulvivirga sp. M361]|uniref:hypothetical protein n=1 Tax=Fulvivirga sp. M361 TaxID=2594266 RepID=UPI0011799E3A|nr:hypothetical protein [Fulvivirga sp. M361]TRX50644.1 hypothetical protein FNH22_25315 [Fulvivirga sp. M361]